MKPRHEDPSVWMCWVAFFTLPIVAFGARLAWYGVRVDAIPRLAMAGLSDSEIASSLVISRGLVVAGMALASVVALVLGPHVGAVGGLLALGAGAAWLAIDPLGYGMAVASLGAGWTTVSVLAAAGVSAGGGAPGLRYATFVAIYAASNAAAMLAPFAMQASPWAGSVGVVASLAVLPVPLLTWWFAKRRPRVPDDGATQRVGLVAALIFVALLATQATLALQDPLFGALTAEWQQAVNPALVMITAAVSILVLLVLQLAKQPARFGALGGVGALMISMACTLAWSMGEGAPALVLLAVVGIAEVFLYPWAYARMTSDAHWRLAGLFAFAAAVPPYLVFEPTVLVSVFAAMILSVLAIPIGGLGWMADTWIFGDEPGPVERRRGMRR